MQQRLDERFHQVLLDRVYTSVSIDARDEASSAIVERGCTSKYSISICSFCIHQETSKKSLQMFYRKNP
jgi:hypothetical protein